MQIMNKMNYVSTDIDNLEIVQINVIDNDLLYVTSVLEKIDYVVSKTYGPFSGYVASEVAGKNSMTLTYTKDGLTTVGNLDFMNPTDLTIANMVTKVALEVKDKSGDGSTTTAKLIYNLVKYAANDIRQNIPNIYTYRIKTPKAIDKVIDTINKMIDERIQHVTTYEELKDVGYIALNNDEKLLEPIDELVKYFKENEIEINGDISIYATLSSDDTTRLIKTPGYKIPSNKLVINHMSLYEEDVKFIFLPIELDRTYLPLLTELHKFGQDHAFKNKKGERQKIIYVTGYMDEDLKSFLRNLGLGYWSQYGDTYQYDYLEVDIVDAIARTAREDLGFLLNTQEVLINDYLEKRKDIPVYMDQNGQPVYGDIYDNAETKNHVKIKMKPTPVLDENGNVVKDENGVELLERDHRFYRKKLMKELSIQVANGLHASINHDATGGFSVTVLPDQDKSERYANHVKELREISKNTSTPDLAADATRRLTFMNDNFYIIEVSQRVADMDRLMDAYRDAARAINSAIKYGYHTGGSASAYIATLRSYKRLLEEKNELLKTDSTELSHSERSKFMEKIRVLDTAIYITDTLIKSYTAIIMKLLPRDLDVFTAFNSKYIDMDNFRFGDSTVIAPVETDKVMIKVALYLFSQLFASLAIEYKDVNSILHIKNVMNHIKDKIDPKPIIQQTKEPEIIKPIQSQYKQSNNGEEVDPDILAKIQERREANKELDRYLELINNERKVNPMMVSSNVEIDPSYTPDGLGELNRIHSELIDKKLSDDVTISGYMGDVTKIGEEVNRAQRANEEKLRKSFAHDPTLGYTLK